MARRLLTVGYRWVGRALRHQSEFCHAACFWRRVGRTGRDQIADRAEAGVVAADRLWPGPGSILRYLRAAIGKPRGGYRLQRRRTDIAGHLERAARRAEPVVDHGNDAGVDQPWERSARPVLADRRQWRRQDHQIGIRKRPW